MSEDERTEEQYPGIMLPEIALRLPMWDDALHRQSRRGASGTMACERDAGIRQQWSSGKAPSSNVSHVAGSPSWEPANASTVAGSKKQFQENNPGGVIS